jgi:hypothetical protein
MLSRKSLKQKDIDEQGFKEVPQIHGSTENFWQVSKQ